ncbi:MAG: hypothetical protein ABR915_04680 [Thermoguttaceae bacterium]
MATPRNIDRDGPKDKSVDWLTVAKAAAGQVTLHPYDGRDIARFLDTDYPDIRHKHLGIPYSRLSGPSILASCAEANTQTIAVLEASGRYRHPGRAG